MKMINIKSAGAGVLRVGIATLLLVLSYSSYAVKPEVGNSYYTSYNFMVEKERHVTTNYWRGELIPINTRVKVDSIAGKKMVLDIDGRKITILNRIKHSKRSIETIADELLSSKKKSLGKKFSDDIEAGNMRLGMTKEQVIMTRGYPPRHKTFATKSNTWVYWSSKFVQRTLVFEKNRLVRGRGLH